MSILIESIIMGIIVTVIGLIVSYIMMFHTLKDELHQFTHWKSLALSFFITGFIAHLISEYTGISKYYCGNALNI